MKNEPEELIPYLTEPEKEELDRLTVPATVKWQPAPNNIPQCQAYESEADILLYGGKPYGGKSDLQLGLARNEHKNSLLLRKTFPELKRGFIPRALEFYGNPKFYNASDYIWKIDGRRIEFGYGDKLEDFLRYKGPNFDLIGIDEASNIARFEDGSTPIDVLLPWNRSTIKAQRVRIVLATNPGGPGEEWLIEYFGPWLDDKHPFPAKHGELRWFIRNDEGNIEDVPENTNGAKSRTFIESSWKDNPYADADEYEKNLNLLPEPLRSQLKFGLWGISYEDDRWQVIPTIWIRLAQGRWVARDAVDSFDSVGVDVAYGGQDKTVFCGRVANWFSELEKHDGRKTPDGQSAAGLLKIFINGDPAVVIDATGYGASCSDFAKEFCKVRPFIASSASKKRDLSGKLGFVNKRAEVWWKFREALDPNSGENVALPPDRELLSDLSAPRWKLKSNGIQIESKEQIIKRLKRSPDCGDATVLAHYGVGEQAVDFAIDLQNEVKSRLKVFG